MEQDVIDGGKSTYARRHLAMIRAMYMVETEGSDPEVAQMEIDLSGLGNEATAADLYVTGLYALHNGDDETASQNVMAMMELSGRDEEVVRVMQHQLKAELLKHEGNHEEALKLMAKAAEMENALPLTYGPPMPVRPANELLGEAYLVAGMAEEAVAAFEAALARAPKRALSLAGLARAAKKAGHQDIARSASDTLREFRQKPARRPRSDPRRAASDPLVCPASGMQ